MEELRVLPIHKHNQYVNDCVRLLNSEWPRSVVARQKSLEPSCDLLPTCLVMIYTYEVFDKNASEDSDTEVESCHCYDDTSSQDDRDVTQPEYCPVCSKNRREVVVGHSKVSRLLCIPEGCLIESVLIHKDFRGRGWGKYLMTETELFIKNFGGLKIVYLTTTDKQRFYLKMGYKPAEPIPIFCNTILETWSLSTAFNNLIISTTTQTNKPSRPKKVSGTKTKVSGDSTVTSPTSKGIPQTDGKQKKVVSSKTKANSKDDAKSAAAVNNHSSDPNGIPKPPPMPTNVHSTRPRRVRKGHSAKTQKTFMIKVLD